VSSPIADAQFFRGVFAGLVFATGMCAVGVIYALIAVPSPPAGMAVSFLP
jgi:xanthosine utilization system XapX-like protein